MTSIAVVTLDTLGAAMAGPAIRAWEVSRALAEENEVRLLTFGACHREGEGFAARHVTVDEFRAEVEAVDVLVVQGYLVATFGWLRSWEGVLVVDLYDPFHLESLEVERYKPTPERHAALANALRELGAQSARGDFFLCASDKQRDLWLGQLAARSSSPNRRTSSPRRGASTPRPTMTIRRCAASSTSSPSARPRHHRSSASTPSRASCPASGRTTR